MTETHFPILKEISDKIEQELDHNNEVQAESETYEVIDNYITGINIAIEDMQFIIRLQSEKDTWEIYADDQKTGKAERIVINSKNPYSFLAKHDLILPVHCKISAIGQFYKPVNESPVQKISGSDSLDLINLLNFLQEKGFIKVYDNVINGTFDDTLDQWYNLPKI